MSGFLATSTIYILLTINPPYDNPVCTYAPEPKHPLPAGVTVSSDGTIDLTYMIQPRPKAHSRKRNTTIEFQVVSPGIHFDNNSKPSHISGVVQTNAVIYPETPDIADQFTPPFVDEDQGATTTIIDLEYSNYWNWASPPSPPLEFGINFVVDTPATRGHCDPNIKNTPAS